MTAVEAPRIEIAAVEKFPSRKIARQALGTDLPYRGVWHAPTPEKPLVHVFCLAGRAEIKALGWGKP